jgi:integrase
MTTVKFISSQAKGVRRVKGTGSVTLRAKRHARDRAVPDGIGDDGIPLFRWLYRSPKGGSRTFLARDRQHAVELAGDFERERQQVPVAPETRGTFAELVESFLRWKARQGGASAPSLATYRRRLELRVLPSLGPKPAASITPTDVSDVLELIPLESAPSTQNAIVSLLTSVFEYALETGQLDRSPMRKKLHRRSEKDARRARLASLREAMPTPDALKRFAEVALARDDPTSSGVALALAMETGLRREELLHLRREDVTLSPGLEDLRVATDFPCQCTTCLADGGKQRTKNRHGRYVPLSSKAAAIVRRQLKQLEREATPGPWLFPVLRHGPGMRYGAGDQMTRHHLDEAMPVIAAAAGMALPKGVQVHFTRHVAISRWETAGLSQAQRDLASGHEAAGVRAAYSHGDRRALFQAFREWLG